MCLKVILHLEKRDLMLVCVGYSKVRHASFLLAAYKLCIIHIYIMFKVGKNEMFFFILHVHKDFICESFPLVMKNCSEALTFLI
jgi:hypothetical protein